MVTIYFDKQLFSHLFKSQEEKYLVLREKILSHRDEFIFTYSRNASIHIFHGAFSLLPTCCKQHNPVDILSSFHKNSDTIFYI